MASMDHRMILGVQQPDFVNTLARSTAAAGMANQNRRQNALEQVYQQYGQDIAQGGQKGLNALAAVDPMAATGLRQQHQSMQFDQEKMRMLRDKAKLDAQMQAARLSADERKQAADNLKGVLRGAAALYQQGDRAGFQAWIQQNGLDPAQYTFDQFPAHLASATGTIEALTEAADYMQGPKPADEYGRYAAEERKAGREPLSRIEYHRAKQKTQQIEVGADGSVRLTEGFGNQGGGKPPTERQSTLQLFGGLMEETMPALNAMEDNPDFDPTSIRSTAAGGGTAGNVVTTPQARQYEALKRQWAEGVLRIQTGAAATEPEIRRVMETYFPRFGDDPATVEQKRLQRDAFARSLVPASGGTMEAPGGAGERAGVTPTVETPSEPDVDTGDVVEIDIDGQKYQVKAVD